jgi:hypothetical protein
MSDYQQMVIVQKTYDMIKYGYICMRQFPKAERHTMVADIKRSMYNLLHLLIAASKKYHKKTTLQEIDIELQFLRTMVRLASELRYSPADAPFLSLKKYENWSKQLNETGKMLGQWIKSNRK